MKSLKFDHNLAKQIVEGKKTSTWRIKDDKNLAVDDTFVVIDKVDPDDKSSWKGIGIGTISSVSEKRLGDLDFVKSGGHEQYDSEEQMYATFRKYYGNEVNEKTPIKVIEFEFKPYKEKQELDDVVENNTTSVTEVKMYSDGGSRGNPGPSASGFVVKDMDDTVLVSGGEYLGVTTNNQAEYHSLRMGLQAAKKLHAKTVHVYMDSMLVVNQMNGIYKVKNRDLWPVYESIKNFATESFEKVTYMHIPRKLNALADAEVNKVLDSVEK